MAERRAEVARSEVAELFRRIRDTQHPHAKEKLEQRMARAAARDIAAGPAIDGWARGGSSQGQKNGVSNPTLQAAEELHDHGKRADPVHDDVRASMADLRLAVAALERIGNRMDRLDLAEAGAKPPELCESCARGDRQQPMELFSDVDGRLDRPWRLDRWCYDRIYRTGKLPTAEQVQRHHDGRRVYDRVAAK